MQVDQNLYPFCSHRNTANRGRVWMLIPGDYTNRLLPSRYSRPNPARPPFFRPHWSHKSWENQKDQPLRQDCLKPQGTLVKIQKKGCSIEVFSLIWNSSAIFVKEKDNQVAGKSDCMFHSNENRHDLKCSDLCQKLAKNRSLQHNHPNHPRQVKIVNRIQHHLE